MALGSSASHQVLGRLMEAGIGGDIGTAYLSPPRIRAVFKPVNLPSCRVKKKHIGGM